MAVVKRWVIMSAVLPSVRVRERLSQSCSAHESVALVGSSRMTSEALRKKARASAMDCHSPPLSSAPPNHLPTYFTKFLDIHPRAEDVTENDERSPF
jgi:hypothetical protein